MKKTERSASAEAPSEIEPCEADQGDDTTCSVCYAEFLEPSDLELHIQQVHPSTRRKLVNCQFCETGLSDAESYMIHIRDVHLLDFKFCSACCRVFTHQSQLRKHEIKHPPSMLEGTYSCSQCSQYFMYKSELQQHELNNHYKTDEGAFLNKYFSLLSSVLNMKADMFLKAVGEKNNLNYTCVACKYQTSNLEAYVLHLRNQNCRSLACDRCSKVYKNRYGLIPHIQKLDCTTVKFANTHKKTEIKQCKSCNKFVHKYLNHKTTKDHVCTPKITCSLCDNVFESMYELSEHQPKAHPLAISLTVCQFCRKECVGTVALEKHIRRTHEHEFHLYKYTCTYCDTTFKHPQRLFAHYLLKHKDLEPYLCKICDKKFRIRKKFTLHIKLQHKSQGFVEFDERLHVFFTDKKSEKPFQPVSKFVKEKKAGDNAKDKHEESEMDKSQELQLANMESDAYQTETEGNRNNKKTMQTRKRKKEDVAMELSDYDSDDEPLLVVKKKAKLKRKLQKKPIQWRKRSRKPSKKQFTCEICKKYCYTFQNYQNHVSMHFKDETKKCVKCSLAFKTKADLERHMSDKHSSSQLTETLKNILARRKNEDQKQEISVKTKFRNTIKKVAVEKDNVTATLRPVNKELSVQKFIEEFTPETDAKNVQINNSISITKITDPVDRQPVIKLTKFKPAPEIHESFIKLTMPVKFKKCNEIHSVTVKKVHTAPIESDTQYNIYEGEQFQDDNDYEVTYEDDNKDTNIPEVEQEVTVEGTEETPKKNIAPHKIVIPKLPKELKSIRIAHLLPEAPYYKIVRVSDIMKQQEKPPVKEDVTFNPAEVRLPDGTKLVNVNPLAHLLGDTPVDQIMRTSKYYKPPAKNFGEMFTRALKRLENPNRKSKKKDDKVGKDKLPKKSGDIEVEGATEETLKNESNPTEVNLPDGTKLVHVNPLAHLLGDTPVDQILKTNKYYKPPPKNVQEMFAKAMKRLDKPRKPKKKGEKVGKEKLPKKSGDLEGTEETSKNDAEIGTDDANENDVNNDKESKEVLEEKANEAVENEDVQSLK